MLLKNLIKTSNQKFQKIEIKDLSLDSRKIKKGDLFFAIKGYKTDGKRFINEAIKNGANAVICSKNIDLNNTKTPVIKVSNIKKVLTTACVIFFKKKPKNIIAVTGTNGKSSVADFFHQILSLNKIPSASIGTLGVKKRNIVKKLNLTSPDIISLHRELENIKKDKIENVIIEASSHGLEQGRLEGVNFKAGIFTNFSHDHLDYHKSMKNYFNSKMILFDKLLNKNKYLITDANIIEFLKLKSISKKRKLKILTINNETISKKNKELTQLVGSFQFKNLSMSILASKLCGIKDTQIDKIFNKIKCVSGRLELIRQLPNKSKIFIDYAHTPDALHNSLNSLKSHYRDEITLVFGCGGNRDQNKRPTMGMIAKNYCNKIYITDDNPRNENPKKIRNDIKKYLKKKDFIEIGDRKKAIKTAIQKSEFNEIILVAGKGHETQQDYGKKIINMSDKDIVKKTKVKKNKLKKGNINIQYNLKILKEILKIKNLKGFKGVSINSKKIKKNNIFIAIKGPNKDGHNYVTNAIQNGASLCVISKKIKTVHLKKLIKVNNTINFLNRLAILKRNNSRATIIGVTGSSGKTTVKTILGNLLNLFADTCFSLKSYNNHYGVPLSLSNLEQNHKYGVFEIGMSKKGEINRLSKMVKPNIGVITNIAEAHIENFKNIKEIAKAKSEIINNITKGGLLILNRDDKFFNFLNKLAKRKKIRVVSFGFSKKSDIYPLFIKNYKNKKITKIKIFNNEILLKYDDVNIKNILISFAILKELDLNIEKILNFFLTNQSLEGRGKSHNIKRYKTKFKLIDESYNANPYSVRNAIFNLSKIRSKNYKKYVLLGDMLELGRKSEVYHKNLSKVINNSNIDKIFVYGNNILNTYKYTDIKKRGNILQNHNDFDEIFSKIINKNDHLMIKGSNATGLHKIARTLIKGAKNVI